MNGPSYIYLHLEATRTPSVLKKGKKNNTILVGLEQVNSLSLTKFIENNINAYVSRYVCTVQIYSRISSLTILNYLVL